MANSEATKKPQSYCEAVWRMEADNVHRHYHDDEYGFPIENDNELFARLVLEINQAGLSWTTILNKKDNFFKAYDQFDIPTVAAYKEDDVARLLSDKGIIRNKLKVAAAIHNANVILGFQAELGSFKAWLDLHHPKTKLEWVKLFKKQFKFTGGEIVNEFLMSSGYLPGAHIESCKVFEKIKGLNPKWMEKEAQ